MDTFWIRVAGIAAVLIALYFLMSPYQNCMRAEAGEHMNMGRCLSLTSW